MKHLAVLFALGAAGCAAHTLSLSTSYDATPRELLPLAVDGARAHGFTVTSVDEERGAFVTLAPDGASGELVEIGLPGRSQVGNVGHCHGACQTTFAVTPLARVAGQLVVVRDPSAAVEDRARELLRAVAQATFSRRYVQMF